MNKKALRKLEFDKLLARLRDHCGSEWGRDYVRGMEIYTSADEVRSIQAETSEAKRFIDKHGAVWDFSGVPDLREAIQKLASGRVLEPSELDGFREALEFAARVKGTKVDRGEFPVISSAREDLFAGTAIARSIAASIDGKANEVRDSASPKLSKTRKRLRELERSIPDSLRRIANSSRMSSVMQDRIVTVRNGRYVIPVKSEHASDGNWVLQDRSSSGATSFVEPLDLVGENNKLTQERLNEKSEVLRILRDLSSTLTGHIEEIGLSLDALGEIDFMLAKGRFSRTLAAVEPELSKNNTINIRSGRHPLLSGEAVPVDITLGGDVKSLVLTGPNAGGKTVTLKMIGLFQLMAQSGLHVPAASGTSLPVFSDVFVVIGDEQSIEENLSTFSSHLGELKQILDMAPAESLVLIDEICSGTDPEEGTALACGVLKELINRGAVCLATSHHGGLKNFAAVTQGAENAAVAFDEKENRPSFRVEIGTPGKSHAIEIARRVGLGERLLDSAYEYMSSQTRMQERLLAELEEMKTFISLERGMIDRDRREIEEEKQKQKKQLDEAEQKRDRILREAFSEAEKILDETRIKCRDIIHEAGRATALPQAAEVKGTIRKVGKKIEKKRKNLSPRKTPVKSEELGPGVQLSIMDTNETVSYLSGPDRKGRVKVLLGDLTMTTDISNLSLSPHVDARPTPGKRDYIRFVAEARESLKKEIDLHGLRVHEALEVLERELETLNLAGAEEVRIVHGIGTGALMKAVREYLDTSPFVTRHEVCNIGRGGIGATTAYFK